LLGQLEHGVYQNSELSLADLERYYDMDRGFIQQSSTHQQEGVVDADYEDGDWIDVEDVGAADAEADPFIHSEPVGVPNQQNPFISETEHLAFTEALQQLETSKYLPPGYGVLSTEWIDGVYPAIQAIPGRKRGSNSLEIGLPHEIWQPRSELWVRALFLMRHIQSLRRN